MWIITFALWFLANISLSECPFPDSRGPNHIVLCYAEFNVIFEVERRSVVPGLAMD